MRRFLPWLLVLVLPPGLAAAEPKDKAKSDEIERKLIPALIEALHDTDPKMRVTAVKSLGHFGSNGTWEDHARTEKVGRKIIPALIETLGDPEAAVRLQVVQALGQLESTAAPALIRAFRDSDNKVRRQAVSALAKAVDGFEKNNKDAFEALLKALQDPNDQTRRYAAYTLTCIYNRAAEQVSDLPHEGDIQFEDTYVKPFVNALKDRQAYVRARVSDVLVFMGRSAQPALLPLLKDPDKTTRVAAAQVLGVIVARGRTKREALLPLTELLHDKSKEVRQAAAQAIEQGLGRSYNAPWGKLESPE